MRHMRRSSTPELLASASAASSSTPSKGEHKRHRFSMLAAKLKRHRPRSSFLFRRQRQSRQDTSDSGHWFRNAAGKLRRRFHRWGRPVPNKETHSSSIQCADCSLVSGSEQTTTTHSAEEPMESCDTAAPTPVVDWAQLTGTPETSSASADPEHSEFLDFCRTSENHPTGPAQSEKVIETVTSPLAAPPVTPPSLQDHQAEFEPAAFPAASDDAMLGTTPGDFGFEPLETIYEEDNEGTETDESSSPIWEPLPAIWEPALSSNPANEDSPLLPIGKPSFPLESPKTPTKKPTPPSSSHVSATHNLSPEPFPVSFLSLPNIWAQSSGQPLLSGEDIGRSVKDALRPQVDIPDVSAANAIGIYPLRVDPLTASAGLIPPPLPDIPILAPPEPWVDEDEPTVTIVPRTAGGSRALRPKTLPAATGSRPHVDWTAVFSLFLPQDKVDHLAGQLEEGGLTSEAVLQQLGSIANQTNETIARLTKELELERQAKNDVAAVLETYKDCSQSLSCDLQHERQTNSRLSMQLEQAVGLNNSLSLQLQQVRETSNNVFINLENTREFYEHISQEFQNEKQFNDELAQQLLGQKRATETFKVGLQRERETRFSLVSSLLPYARAGTILRESVLTDLIVADHEREDFDEFVRCQENDSDETTMVSLGTPGQTDLGVDGSGSKCGDLGPANDGDSGHADDDACHSSSTTTPHRSSILSRLATTLSRTESTLLDSDGTHPHIDRLKTWPGSVRVWADSLSLHREVEQDARQTFKKRAQKMKTKFAEFKHMFKPRPLNLVGR